MIPYSVIMPVKNEADNIQQALECLLAQTRLPDEIVVVDAGSTDQTPQILAAMCARYPRIKVIRVAHAFAGQARNIAIAAAAYDTIAMIDAGMYAPREWAAELLAVMERQPAPDIVFGSTAFVTDTPFERCYAVALGLPAEHVMVLDGIRFMTHAVHSVMLHRRVWREVGGFREDIYSAEDRIFVDAVRRRGCVIAYAPRARVRWIPRQRYSDIVVLGRKQGHDLRVTGINRGYVVKLCVFYFLFSAGIVLSCIVSPWYLCVPLALVLLRLRQRLRDAGDGAVTVRRSPRALGTILLMIMLHGAGTLVGYIEQTLSRRYLN